MTTCRHRLFSSVLSAVIALFMFVAATPAQDATALARSADKQLRTAERSMFAGKAEQAQGELLAATRLIAQLRKLDPGNSRLRSLDTKHKRLERDLARRLGRDRKPSGKEPAKNPAANPPAKGAKLPAGEAAAPKGPTAEQIAADAALVAELAKKFAEPLDSIHGNSLVYGLKLEDANKALAQLEAVEKEALPVLQPALARLTQTYGNTAMAVNNKIHKLGGPREHQFGGKLERLIEGAKNVVKSRAASAESVARNAKMMLSSIDNIAPDVRVPRMQEWKGILQIGQRLDPNNAAINAWLADIDARIGEVAEAIEKDIGSKTWAGHIGDFAGPGEVKPLAAEALAWFRKDKRWGGNPKKKVEMLAVAVRGPWQVAERDVFGRVIRWRLPIHVAVTDAAMRAQQVARVYELSIVAKQGAPDAAAKAPPFDGYWVGKNWKMRLAKLPQ